eukprot:TRINITY_DN30118_c0_g1_i1.p1 TRINITY_DN30118_c0_g1~~TRINITY_DN30118_c0_g1_i1.p1  ORF type:complete len:760 (+),score=220.65 TRINITY_DN30118_c0_g1_i1:71-2350(+)
MAARGVSCLVSSLAPASPLRRKHLQLHDEASAYDALKGTDFSTVTSAALEGICDEIHSEIVRHAAVSLSLLLLPRVYLAASRRKEKKVTAETRQHAVPRIAAMLKEAELFSLFPDECLHTLAEQAVPVETEGGDTIISEGDALSTANGKFAVWFLLHGEGDVVKKRVLAPDGADDDPTTPLSPATPGFTAKRKEDMVKEVVSHFSAPKLFGETELFTDEPRAASIVLTTECDCWCLSKAAVAGVLESLAPRLVKNVYSRAFLRRENKHGGAPVSSPAPQSLHYIRASFLFKGLSDRDAAMLCEHLEPLCVREGQAIYTQGDTAASLYILYRGEARADPPFAAHYTCSGDGDGAAFGEMAFLFDCGRHHTTVRALRNCHLWELPYAKLQGALRQSSLQRAVYANSQRHRLAFLMSQRPEKAPSAEPTPYLASCVAAMRQHTLLGEVCPEAFITDLARAMRPEVYLPSQGIVSSVSVCDRMLYFQSGRAQVHNEKALAGHQHTPYHLRSGDVVGLTCVAFHRWLFPVIATTGCDVWACDKASFVALLHKHDVYTPYVAAVKRAMTEPSYLPLPVSLGRRQHDSGLMSPPVLHPIPGLPEGAKAFHLHLHEGGRSSKRHAKGKAPKQPPGEGKAATPPAEKPSHKPHQARKCWIVESAPRPGTKEPAAAVGPPAAAPPWTPRRPSGGAPRCRRPSEITAALDSIMQRQATMRELVDKVPSMRRHRTQTVRAALRNEMSPCSRGEASTPAAPPPPPLADDSHS